MAFAGLTDKPRVPALIRAALRATAAGALLLSPGACADDDSGDESNNSNGDDVAPTAGPCFHDPDSPGCATGGMTMTMTSAGTMDMGEDTAMDTAEDDDPTADSNDDQAPTIPCAHDPSACESTGAVDDTGDGSSGDTGGTAADTGGTAGGSGDAGTTG